AEGTTILEAAKTIGVHIPTLCHMDLHGTKMINQVGTCRVCMVEQEGRRNLAPACSTVCYDGMVIKTSTPRAIKARHTMMELFLSNHPKDCLVCERNAKCELQNLAADMGIRSTKFEGKQMHNRKDVSSKSLIRCPDKCILCRRCETMCNKVQTVGVYSAINRGFDTVVGTAYDNNMTDTSCTFCGQCVSVCPTGALTQVDNTSEVWDAINNPDKFVIVQTAPAVRVALGEMFDMPVGTSVTGKMCEALHRMGFDKVYDTNFTADLTIMEEATEFMDRFKNGGKLPMLTSCCPAWVKFIEHQFPSLLDVPSTAKSPQQMFGAIAKTYLAEKLGVKRENMVVVSVMPCLAKKFEAAREEFGDDVDFVLSTRELGRMIKSADIDFVSLPDSKFDEIMGESTGAADIFGTTGGVAEAAIRTASAWVNGGAPVKIDWQEIRGLDGIREAEVDIGGVKIKMAIANGLGNIRTIFEQIEAGEKEYHLIEVMACPGGCVGGGGQPYYLEHNSEVLEKRAAALYEEDKGKALRLSHENSQIKKLYEEFLGEPGSHKAHELLHTKYVKRG
ncbi:MAG: NADH-dependent [FeFe] hydrogenase, group A6, partial [Oscillospiraceae bacterium]|nr:NADH-dependent [FeFe] hydrogenase, group A6 [Oscillospiraceae bacterium]